MNYSNLRSQILAAIKYPPKISAASLQEQLINIVNGLDLGALLLGVATPSLAPNTEANGFYFALQSGTYTNFPTINGQTITVDSSEVAIIVRSGNYWSKIHITTYPTIDPKTKHWMIGNEDTGVLAEGTTPHIDQESGNWMIGTYDTGIHAQGAPGKDAYQPFKGSFSSVQDLNAAYPEPNDGDTAYVEDTVENTTVLKVYDVVNGGWHDTGTTADSPVFGSGQFLNTVKIDETHLANPADGSLPKAEDVMQLKAKLEGVTASETKVTPIEDWYPEGSSSGFYKTDKTWNNNNNFCSTRIDVHSCKKVVFLGLASKNTTLCALLTDSVGNIIDSSIKSYKDESVAENYFREYSYEIADYENAYYLVCPRKNTPGTLESKLYCFLYSGDTVLDYIAATNLNVNNLKDTLQQPFDLSVLNGIYVDFVIGVSTKNWVAAVLSNPRQSYIIPVKEGDKITITSTDNNQVQYGFLSSFSNPVEGEQAPLIGNELYFLNTDTTPDKERTQVIPTGAKYLYVKAVDKTQRTFPKSINIIPKEERFLYEGHYEGISQYDTYIEENIYSSYISNTNYVYKTYKLEEGVDYKVIVNIQPSQTYALAAMDGNMNQLQTFLAGTGSVDFKVMEDLPSLPSGTKYVVIVFLRGSDTYTYTGCGALMRPLKNDSFAPTNKNIYCVSKIYTPQFPYDRNEENQSFVQQEQWSAWSFMLPSSYRGNFTKKYPIVAFLHGSSAFLTSEVMSYNSANTNEGIVGNLLDKGFVVFDINGYGVSYESDRYSQHWGCPAAVDTMKKAYTIIVDRFNGRKGMVVSGISMGGAIAKSYCMTYPEDVVACALEAPSEIGCSIRTGIGQNGNFSKAWNAWDFVSNRLDLNVFLGYSPLINPQLIESNGSIIHKGVDEWNLSDWIDNSSPTKLATNMQLYGSFPVEIVIWHGDKDANVDLGYSQQFIRTIRNAGCNGKLRLCPNCEHNLNNYEWVKKEVVDFISQKLSC